MSLLDMRTVLLSYLITSALCALMMLSLWRQNRRQPGISLWLTDFVMQFVGLLLISIRGAIPDFLSMVVSNLLIVGGTLVLLIGLERYTDRVSSHRYNTIYLVGYTGIQIYFVFVQPSLQFRNINFSVALALFCSQCVWLLWRRVDVEMRQDTRLLGLVLAGLALLSVSRVPVDLSIHPGDDLFSSGVYDTLIILTYQMLYIALTFALVLLVNRRLQTSLKNDMVARERANEALRFSEEKFAKAFRTSPYAITITHALDGKFIDVNDSFVSISGIAREEALADTTVNLKIWADLADRAQVVDALRAGRPVVGWEFLFRRKNGEVFPGSISAQIIQLDEIPVVLSSIEDITERKQAEEALTKREVLLNAMGKIANVGGWEIDIDAQRLRWTSVVYELHEVATTYQPTVEAALDFYTPESRPILAQAVQKAIEEGEPFDLELQIITAKGNHRWVHAVGQALEHRGTVHTVSGIYQDITERKRAEAEQMQQARLALFRAEANEAMNSVADLDSALQVCSEAAVSHLGAALARIWLLEPGEDTLVLHASAGLYTHLDGAHGRIQVGYAKIGILAAEGTPHLTNAVLTDPQISDQDWARREGLVAFAGYPLLAGGRLVGVFAMFARQTLPVDLLDALGPIATTLANGVARRQAEQALQASQAALARQAADLARSNTDLERFAHIVSHDLQEPLRMVDSFVTLLGNRYRGQLDDNADKYIGFAVDGVRRMQQFIKGLLTYSHVGTRGEQFRATDANAALKDALWNLNLAVTDARAVITHDPLPTVLADSTQLTQLFQNLIGNAVKFHGQDPPVVHITANETFKVTESTKEWKFAVRDNGIGIDPKDCERIFGILQRLHTQQEYPGTGLGLAICQRIVERHGGRIWVESAPGVGSTFFFTLPSYDP